MYTYGLFVFNSYVKVSSFYHFQITRNHTMFSFATKSIISSTIFLCFIHTVSTKPRLGLSSLFAEHIKQKIIIELERNPDAGTRIMSTKDMLKEICLAKPFNQTITHDNCTPKTIENNFCYGQCNSLYIPEVTDLPMATCFTCQPSQTVQERVPLQCIDNNRFQQRFITVEKILSCQFNQCHV